MKKIAIYGGSFDPIHVGHLTTALYVKATQDVDEVWFEPVYKHPSGKQLQTSFHDRINMASDAILDFHFWARVMWHEEKNLSGKTIDLIRYLKATYPTENYKFKLIVGSDVIYSLDQWKEWDEINEMVEVIVINRPGFPSGKAVGPVQSSISSTTIREKLFMGDDVKDLLPTRVLDYVTKNGLYKKT